MRVIVFEIPRSNQVSKAKAGFVDVLLRVKQIVVLKRNKPTIRLEPGRYITDIL